MHGYNRAFFRYADRFCQRIGRKSSDSRDLSPPGEAWQSVHDCFGRLNQARERGWQGPVQELTVRLESECRDLKIQVQSAVERAKLLATCGPSPQASDVFREIAALDEEFDDVECDVRAGTLAVTTGPITLEDLKLGRFQVVLELQGVNSYTPYRVIALDPNPAAKCESITHPHVRDEHLCAGHGYDAIRSALEQGRLYDFFMLINRVLHTYARGEAYSELNDWHWVRCADCDATSSEESRRECPECEAWICEDCGHVCQSCDQDCCGQCAAQCPRCRQWHCPACFQHCGGCHEDICPSCMEGDLCASCYEDDCDAETDNQDTVTNTTTSIPSTSVAVQSYGLGQAAVPARLR